MKIEEYIKEIELNRLKEVDFAHYYLDKVPNEVLSFDWIEEISFGHILIPCKLKELPVELIALPKLKRLDLCGAPADPNTCQILDFSEISRFVNLEFLNVSNSYFSDISLLLPLTKLKYLNISNTKITNFNVLAELTNLVSLDISANNIQSLEFLSNHTKLEQVNLSENPINSIEAIQDLKQLTNIMICACPNLDHTSLIGFKSLINIEYQKSQWDTHDHNLDFIKNFPLLKTIWLKTVSPADLKTLAIFQDLEELVIENFAGEYLDLPFYQKIKEIGISGNFKESVSFFDYTQLVKFEFDSVNMTSLKIANCPNLETINIRTSKSLEDLEIKNCPNLKYLDIWGTNISTIDFIDDWSTIETLGLNDILKEKIDELTSIKHLTNKYNTTC